MPDYEITFGLKIKSLGQAQTMLVPGECEWECLNISKVKIYSK